MNSIEIVAKLANLRERIDALVEVGGEGAYHQDEAALLTAYIHFNIMLRLSEAVESLDRIVSKLDTLDKTILTMLGVKMRP